MKKYLTILVPIFVIACAHLTTQDKTELGEDAATQKECLITSKTRAEYDACVENVRKYWDNKWNQRFDGGFGN